MTTPKLVRMLGPAADVAAVVVLVVAGRMLLPPDVVPEGAPWWARSWDLIIFGPDSGAWAANASALFDGRIADLDPHRMPTWPILTAAMMNLYPVGPAGHLVNHLLQAAMPVAIWAIARAWDGRATAFAAGLTAAMLAPPVTAAQRFGVDPTVATLLPVALAAAMWGGRVWWTAPLVGVVTAACAVSHLTTLAFPIPILLLLLFVGQPGWRRWAGFVLAVATTAGIIWWLSSWYPVLGQGIVANVFAEGIAPAHHGGADGAGTQKQAAAMEVLRQNLPAALDDTLRFFAAHLRPPWLPWTLALTLPWLGLLGPVRREDAPLRALLRGLALGLPLLACLAPVLAFHAAKSPARYSENLLPVAALLFVRGAMVVPSLVERALSRFDVRVAGVLVTLLAVPWCVEVWRQPRIAYALPSPRNDELRSAAVGNALMARFPSGTGVISTYREALGYGGHLYCPSATCPFQDDPTDFLRCIEIMRKECRGDGPIPYVVYPGVRTDLQWAARTSMDTWLTTQLQPVEVINADYGTAAIYEIPRTGSLTGAP